MLINEWDISEVNARQWNVTFGGHAISNESFWEDNSNTPVFLPNNVGFKTITVKVLIKSVGREKILEARSMILSKLLAPCTLTLDGYSHKFFGVMKKFNKPEESSMNRFHTLTFDFDCYEFGDLQEVSTNGRTEIEIMNQGNLLSPVIMVVESSEPLETLIIKGVSRNATILNGPLDTIRTEAESEVAIFTDSGNELLTDDGFEIWLSDIDWVNDLPMEVRGLLAGKKIEIDGITGILRDENGVIPDVTFWELPTLMPGSNIITISDVKANVTFRYFPRYM